MIYETEQIIKIAQKIVELLMSYGYAIQKKHLDILFNELMVLPPIETIETINLKANIIQEVVCKKFAISLLDIKQKSRHRQVVLPRQTLMYFLYMFLKPIMSTTTVGEFCGGYNHATVCHAINVVSQNIEIKDKRLDDYKESFKMIEKEIYLRFKIFEESLKKLQDEQHNDKGELLPESGANMDS